MLESLTDQEALYSPNKTQSYMRTMLAQNLIILDMAKYINFSFREPLALQNYQGVDGTKISLFDLTCPEKSEDIS